MPNPVRPDDAHDEAEELLPWYATGQLDAKDQALVERHLSSCARCQRQLGLERVLVEEFRSFAPEVDTGWTRLRDRIESPTPARSRIAGIASEVWQSLNRPAVAALATAQLAFVVVAGSVLLSLSRPAYRALGASEAPSAANVLVMFRAEATEADIRGALRASGASLVGGPTSANAYLLHVQANRRSSALANLRADEDVQMAEPIDGAGR
jgi:anti-sigma factor RsiW